MLHNGYSVPPDMLDSAGMAASAGENSAHGANPASVSDGQSFAGDFRWNVKFNVELKKDYIQLKLNISLVGLVSSGYEKLGYKQ
ncbi:hypothetical protein RJ639_022092 [Escallonia herrerae]|uniref:ABC transporter family G domain-containing protein n=1 Tax=Escallonia herrerae TaxID=1293975 RepID=A0AA88V8F9_9ASTE|nr:hypothetical protein RJ639_022092 [Escallonia herrerae]